MFHLAPLRTRPLTSSTRGTRKLELWRQTGQYGSGEDKSELHWLIALFSYSTFSEETSPPALSSGPWDFFAISVHHPTDCRTRTTPTPVLARSEPVYPSWLTALPCSVLIVWIYIYLLSSRAFYVVVRDPTMFSKHHLYIKKEDGLKSFSLVCLDRLVENGIYRKKASMCRKIVFDFRRRELRVARTV